VQKNIERYAGLCRPAKQSCYSKHLLNRLISVSPKITLFGNATAKSRFASGSADPAPEKQSRLILRLSEFGMTELECGVGRCWLTDVDMSADSQAVNAQTNTSPVLAGAQGANS
jgi:hypothetical protein